MPTYDLQNTSGQPHQRNFEILAKVGSIVSMGEGTSKKDAKRTAAVAMLDKLKALGSDVTNAANVVSSNSNNSGGNNGSTPAIEPDEELLKKVSEMKVDTLVRNTTL